MKVLKAYAVVRPDGEVVAHTVRMSRTQAIGAVAGRDLGFSDEHWRGAWKELYRQGHRTRPITVRARRSAK